MAYVVMDVCVCVCVMFDYEGDVADIQSSGEGTSSKKE